MRTSDLVKLALALGGVLLIAGSYASFGVLGLLYAVLALAVLLSLLTLRHVDRYVANLYVMFRDPDSLSDEEKYRVYQYSCAIMVIALALVLMVTFALNLPSAPG
jgi:hypothetical protein